MSRLRWILSVLFAPILREQSISFVRPTRIDWNPSLFPRTIQINGHTIFYTVKGEGKPILLLHGYGAGIWVWEKQIEALSQSYLVYALDLIGHGYSDRPKISYTPETYIHFLRDFMDGVGIEKATLIGNSTGGGMAWAMAIRYPE
jgi:pimeloyl-ACP methyl ester carboxylesterase